MSRFQTDRIVGSTLRLVASIAVLLVILIVVFLAIESADAIWNLGPRLFSDKAWVPAESAGAGQFGLYPIFLGTLLVTLGAALIAAPLGVASAVFSQFYAPSSVAFVYRRIVELLVGIPSVVFGFWGLVVLCPAISHWSDQMFGWQVPGPSLLAAILVVALMILPTVMLISESAIKRVSSNYVKGATALAMGRLAIIRCIVLPEARTGIVTGVVLAIARALGETMAVVMVAGNIVKVPGDLFDPVSTLTANVALEMGYAVGVHRSALYFSGLLLLLVVAILFAAEIFLRRFVWRTAA